MYPSEFEYYRADTLEDAFALVADHEKRETQFLAGGHSLLPSMKTGLASPDVVVDIGSIDTLVGIGRTGDTVEIGAGTRYATISTSELVAEHAPSLATAVGAIGDEQVRHRGTIGGNVAHADPASDLPAALLAEDATIEVTGRDGVRTLGPEEFFEGMYATSLGEHELVTSIDVPVKTPRTIGVYRKKPDSASGFPIVGVAVVLGVSDDRIETAAVAANGVMDKGVRLEAVEAALGDTGLAELDVDEVASRAGSTLDSRMVMDDRKVSAEFRLHLLERYTAKAVREALERAVDAPAD